MLELFVHWAAGFGLNYSFLLDAYQRGSLVQGALTTGLLCLFTIVGSLLAGISLAAMLTFVVIVIIAALAFFPALTLGPLAEHFSMIK